MQIKFEKSAIREIRKVPVEIAVKLAETIGRYAENRNAAIDLKPMQGAPNTFRIRVRDWRMIFTVQADMITVTRIGPRGSIY